MQHETSERRDENHAHKDEKDEIDYQDSPKANHGKEGRDSRDSYTSAFIHAYVAKKPPKKKMLR